jgi:hypothetical protein
MNQSIPIKVSVRGPSSKKIQKIDKTGSAGRSELHHCDASDIDAT